MFDKTAQARDQLMPLKGERERMASSVRPLPATELSVEAVRLAIERLAGGVEAP